MAEGAADQWTRVAAYGIVLDRQGRILLAHGSFAPTGPPSWTLPGGGVRFGEALRHAARREIQEESGLVCEIGEVVDVNDELLVRADDRKLHAVRVVYRAIVVSGELRVESGGSTDDVRWVPIQDVERLPVVAWLPALLRRGARGEGHPAAPGG